MSKHFTTSDGIKIDGFDNATEFNKALRVWEEKENLKASIVKQQNDLMEIFGEEKNNEK